MFAVTSATICIIIHFLQYKHDKHILSTTPLLLQIAGIDIINFIVCTPFIGEDRLKRLFYWLRIANIISVLGMATTFLYRLGYNQYWWCYERDDWESHKYGLCPRSQTINDIAEVATTDMCYNPGINCNKRFNYITQSIKDLVGSSFFLLASISSIVYFVLLVSQSYIKGTPQKN